MQDFKQLRVWQRSLDLAHEVCRVTEELPARERFGLTSQMRSAVVSISSNLAEGSGRLGTRDKARFVQIAIGSACELESQVLLAERLGLLRGCEDLSRSIDSLRRQMIRFRQRLEEA